MATMPVRFIRSALVLVMLAMLATACVNGDSANDGADPTLEPSTGTPAAERTGNEPPAPGGGDKPAIETAGAPAGDGGFDKNDDGAYCLYVQWLGQQDGASAGEGAAFEVTEVRLSGVEPADFGSCLGTPCVGFTFDSNSDGCTYAVRPSAAGGTLALYGRVLCSGSAEDCQKFKSSLVLRPTPIPPSDDESESPTPTTTPSPTPTPTPTGEPTEPESPEPDSEPSPAE
jgi:hypothetical protein